VTLRPVTVTVAEANAYVAAFHRHNGAVPSGRFAVAAVDDAGAVHGVAIAGQPVARMAARPGVLEVRRVCTDGERNCCSFLYGCCTRAAKALGYWRLITYTVAVEDGASLKASGWRAEAAVAGLDSRSDGGWAGHPRPGRNLHDTGPKTRWAITLGHEPPPVVWPAELASPQLAIDFDAVAVLS